MAEADSDYMHADRLTLILPSLPMSPDSIKPNTAPITAAKTLGRNIISFNMISSKSGVLLGITPPKFR